jgi:hypothetical protein
MTDPSYVRPLWLRIPATFVHVARAIWQTLLRDWKPGYQVEQECQDFPDISPAEMTKLLAVEGFTMTGIARRYALIQAVQHLVKYKIKGAFIECGVWHGGSMMLVANELLACGVRDRELYLFDTFEGMTPPSALDQDWTGADAQARLIGDEAVKDTSHMWCISPLQGVKRNMALTGYPQEHVHFIQGPVEVTIPDQAPAEIALLRLDTDWYESTAHELEHLYDRLVPGGILIIDDYGYWQGSRRAVDEFIASRKDPIFLHRIDLTARMIIKSLAS